MLNLVQTLVQGGSVPIVQADTRLGDEEQTDGEYQIFIRPTKTITTVSQSRDESWADSMTNWHPKGPGHGLESHKSKPAFNSRHNSSAQEDDISWDPDLDRDSMNLTIPRPERKQYAREEKRTILAKNLSDRTTHQDIIQIIRGGLVLDIYLRTTERSASISFVEGCAAQNFMSYVKRNDMYIHGKRVSAPRSQAE